MSKSGSVLEQLGRQFRSPTAPGSSSSADLGASAGRGRDTARWILALAACVALGAYAMHTQIGDTTRTAVDLFVYRNAGTWVLHGYSPYAPSFGRHLVVPLPFTYPPFAALVAVPLALAPEVPLAWVWDAACLVVLALVLAVYFRPLAERAGRWMPMAYAALFIAALWTRPVRNNLGFGQIDILLMAICMLDLLVENPRWPRGLLIGLLAAIQVAPAIFGVYLLLSRRWSAFWTALLTALAATAIGAIFLPGSSFTYFTKLLFKPNRVGNVAYFSNQSLWGMLARASFGYWHTPVLALGLVVILVGGLAAAVVAGRDDGKLAVALVGLVWVLVSPVTWIHGEVWLLPAIALVVADARSPWRVGLGLLSGFVLVYHIRNLDRHPALSGIPAALRGPLVDVYGLLAVVLLVVLSAAPLRKLLRDRSLRPIARVEELAGSAGVTAGASQAD